MEPERIPALETLAESYVKARDERMALTKKEIEKRDLLIAKLKEHKLTSYEFDGRTIALTTKEKVTVRTSADEEEDED